MPEADRLRLREKFVGMMRALHKEDGATLRIGIMADDEIRGFIDTHADVLDSGFRSVTMSDAMRQRLERSNWIFSGIKTFHELNEAFPSLTDEDGSRKPFERFLNDVQKIDDTYNRNYLRSEYNFVQSSADMAAKWEEFAADGDRYLLQYRTAGDDKVRPEHAELNGVTLPIDDDFWAEYYPPNGWNCRCTVVQVRRGKYEVTPHDEAMTRGEAALQRDKKGIFRFNSGIQQKTVPDYNPYTISACKSCPVASGKVSLAFAPTNQLCAACKIVRQCAGDSSKSATAIERKHYLHEMEPLTKQKVRVNGNGHTITVGFRKDANRHLYSDTFWRNGGITKTDLAKLDQILASATFVTKAGLSKPRKDDIKRFYYYKAVVNGKVVYLNVAETDYVKKNGRWYHERFLYSITDRIKE